jgi:hypothetical protein
MSDPDRASLLTGSGSGSDTIKPQATGLTDVPGFDRISFQRGFSSASLELRMLRISLP